jgi:hypothetical protein
MSDNKYTAMTVQAVRLLKSGVRGEPIEAWKEAARQVAPHAPSSATKPCPKNAFLGLCEDGLVPGFDPMGAVYCTHGTANKKKAVTALRMLSADAGWIDRKSEWWRKVAGPNGRPHQEGVLDVVIGLWRTRDARDQGAGTHE